MGGFFLEGGVGHPSMSYFTHNNTFPTVGEMEMTLSSSLSFLPALMTTTW